MEFIFGVRSNFERGSAMKKFYVVLFVLFSFKLYAQNFNNRLSVQGFLKSGGLAINDATGFPMRFLIKRNSTLVWCQSSTANIPVVNGVFSSLLSGSSDCENLTNTLDSQVFLHSANSDLFLIDVVVDTAKDGFGSVDDATFAGIDLVPAPMSISSYQAEVAKSLTGTLSIASGGTGATTVTAARANLGLGSVSAINTSGNASQVLLGNGTFGSVPAPVQFTGNLSGDVTGSQSTTSVVRIRGQNVSATLPSEGQVLTWNGTTSEWQAVTPVSAPVATVAGKTGNVQLVSTDITDAASANTASRIVIRDGSGNFSAGTITASVFSAAAGGTTVIGTTTGASATTIQAGTGKVRVGSTGTAVAAMGSCTIAAVAITNTAANRTCAGVPASTAVSVHCSAATALSNPNTNSLYCRASGVANQIVCNTTAANTVSTTYVCMWMQP